MIKVYQIQLTDLEITVINEGAPLTGKGKAYFDRSFDNFFKAENFQYYTHVATVDTDDMEEAFEMMNLWENESAIERITPRCSSMSVGDILEDADGKLYRCASIGFTAI